MCSHMNCMRQSHVVCTNGSVVLNIVCWVVSCVAAYLTPSVMSHHTQYLSTHAYHDILQTVTMREWDPNGM